MKTLAEMTEEEQARSIGMWADVRVAGQVLTEVIGEPVVDGLVTMVDPNGGRTYQLERCAPIDVTPRLDLLPAWTPEGEPIPAKPLWGVQFQPHGEDEWYLLQACDTRDEAAQYIQNREGAGENFRVVVSHRPRYSWTPA